MAFPGFDVGEYPGRGWIKLTFFVLSFDQEALSVNQDNASLPWLCNQKHLRQGLADGKNYLHASGILPAILSVIASAANQSVFYEQRIDLD